MDLGIAGKWALVCAASRGLGKGCAQALDAHTFDGGAFYELRWRCAGLRVIP